jgi:hypothetical protein
MKFNDINRIDQMIRFYNRDETKFINEMTIIYRWMYIYVEAYIFTSPYKPPCLPRKELFPL